MSTFITPDTTIVAPGRPGMTPRWTSSSKSGVGTSMTSGSFVWFSLSHGIVNEVYYPHSDLANIRDMQFVVTDGKNFFSEERRHTLHEYRLLEEGVPAYHVTNTCLEGRYRIEKIVITDPHRSVLLTEVRFTPLVGKLEDYHVYVLLAPHICNAGWGNDGWSGDHKGYPMLYAQRAGMTLACAASVPFLGMNCGYVGTSDTWQDLYKNKRMTTFYPKALDGNIALGAEIDIKANNGHFVLGLGFGIHPEAAGMQVRSSLFRDFSWTLKDYIASWLAVQAKCAPLFGVDEEGSALYRISTAVLKIHEGKFIPGSLIASLSIPWGFAKGDNELGGYHLIWSRDQVNAAQAFLSAGDRDTVREILLFLLSTQEKDGHWVQCFWVDGRPYWRGLQMDETALPILLADHLRRLETFQELHPWPMVEKAAAFILQNGPSTEQDRWEENAGYTPYTIAIEIAALLSAADFFDNQNKPEAAEYLRETADWWQDNIDHWLYVTNTELCRRVGVEGYYVRIAPTELFQQEGMKDAQIIIKNRPVSQNLFHYAEIVSVDALALVRFGIRSATDPRILNTVKVIDALLKTDTEKGPVWHRYNEDGYGEQEDGSPFDETGIGRGWPLLVGERAHYELAKGNTAEAIMLLRTMTKMAGTGGLIPEQVWDSPDIPEKSLFNGQPTGSAKPLVWAHAEYLTLLRSLSDGKVFDMPPQTVQRYQNKNKHSACAIWRLHDKCWSIPAGKKLRIQSQKSGRIRWSTDDWHTFQDIEMTALPDLKLFYADLPVQKAPPGTKAVFTFFWTDSQAWDGTNYQVALNAEQ